MAANSSMPRPLIAMVSVIRHVLPHRVGRQMLESLKWSPLDLMEIPYLHVEATSEMGDSISDRDPKLTKRKPEAEGLSGLSPRRIVLGLLGICVGSAAGMVLSPKFSAIPVVRLEFLFVPLGAGAGWFAFHVFSKHRPKSD